MKGPLPHFDIQLHKPPGESDEHMRPHSMPTTNMVVRVPALLTILALLSLVCLATTSCGSDEGDAQPVKPIPISNLDYGTRAADVGNPRDLNHLANLYATLQRRFQAGDMVGTCARVSLSMLSQFPSGPSSIDGPCTKQLITYARRLRRDRAPRPRLKIAWLRIYDDLNLAGITATDSKGRRLRVPFLREAGGWKLQLGVFTRPDTLNGTLLPTP